MEEKRCANHLVKCFACKSDIERNATICPHCQSYQQKWKNNLRFAAVAAGLLAILSSAGTYIWGEVNDWHRQQNWIDKVEVIDFSRLNDSTFLNSGYGEIYLSYVHLEFPENGWETTIPINISIRPGEFAVLPAASDVTKKIEKHKYQVGTSVSDALFHSYLHATSLWDDCLFFDARLESGPVFHQFKKSIGSSFPTCASTATLHYRSSFKGDWKSLTIPLKGIPHLSAHADCSDRLEWLLRSNSAESN